MGGSTAETLTLRVPFDVGRLTPNLRLHWATRAERTKAARNAARAVWFQSGCPEIVGRVRVSIIVRRTRKLDPLQLWASYKAVEDGLFNGRRNGYGITPDDSDRYVEYGTATQETGARWRGCEEVEVRVEALCSRSCRLKP